MAENNNKKRWGRRLGTTIGWVVLTTIAYYICMFKGLDLDWWLAYAKYTTIALGFLVGGLTITDSVIAQLKK